jgi:hypothetical protein
MAAGGQEQITADIKKGEENLRGVIVYDRTGLTQEATASKQTEAKAYHKHLPEANETQ